MDDEVSLQYKDCRGNETVMHDTKAISEHFTAQTNRKT